MNSFSHLFFFFSVSNLSKPLLTESDQVPECSIACGTEMISAKVQSLEFSEPYCQAWVNVGFPLGLLKRWKSLGDSIAFRKA